MTRSLSVPMIDAALAETTDPARRAGIQADPALRPLRLGPGRGPDNARILSSPARQPSSGGRS